MEEFDWLSSNSKTAYPFTERQTDGTHGLFVDASVYHTNLRAKKEPVYLSIFDSTPGSERVQLRFSDSALLLDLSTLNASFRKTVFGAYTIFEWSLSLMDDSSPDIVFNPVDTGFTVVDQSVKLVVLTSALTLFATNLTLTAYLIPSLVNAMAKGVRRLFVRLPDLVTPTLTRFFEVLGNKVIFRSGLNTQLSVATRSTEEAAVPRSKKKIVVDVEPGSGQGYFVSCDPSQQPGIRTINKVPPNALGNVALTGQDCLWVETLIDDVISEESSFENTDYIALLRAGTLGLHNDCGACCDCTDYSNAYENIRSAWNSAKGIATRVEALRTDYNDLVDVVDDIASGPAVKGERGQIVVQAVVTANYQLSATVTFENTTDFWLRGNIFKITTTGVPGFKPTPGSGQWLISDEAGSPIFVDPISSDVYDTPTQAYSMMEMALPWAKPGVRYSYRFSGRFDAVAGFSRQNNASALAFKFENNGGYIKDPNDPFSEQSGAVFNLSAQTPFRLIGPPAMS